MLTMRCFSVQTETLCISDRELRRQNTSVWTELGALCGIRLLRDTRSKSSALDMTKVSSIALEIETLTEWENIVSLFFTLATW